jgi:hypothetical protein
VNPARRHVFSNSVVSLVYEQFPRFARGCAGKEHSGHTPQTTGLRLIDDRDVDWQGQTHFFAVCVRIMRRILVGVASERSSLERGG